LFPDTGSTGRSATTEANLEDDQFSREVAASVSCSRTRRAGVLADGAEEIAFGPLNMGLTRDEVNARRHTAAMLDIASSPNARRTSCRAGRRSGSRSRRSSS
jgi:hypothetical protein